MGLFVGRLSHFRVFLGLLVEPEVLLEAPLVMIEPILLGVKHASHITLNIQLIQDLLVTRPDNDTLCKLFCPQQKTASHDLVGVEGFRVGADQLVLGTEGVVEVSFGEVFFVFSPHDLEIVLDNTGVLVVMVELGRVTGSLHF